MQEKQYDGFTCQALSEQYRFYSGWVPEEWVFSKAQFEYVWALHPQEYHTIMIHGRPVQTPRWQGAFEADYHYTGRVNKALPAPPLLKQLLEWGKAAIDDRLVGILVNWYDGQLGHYIGAHRDSTKHMVVGAPIVTLSFGEERVFRLRPWKGSGFQDFRAVNGGVFIMPYETNLAWTHEVPHRARDRGRRISVTLRAFETGLLQASA